MDLFAFIHRAYLTKVKVGEREVGDEEVSLLELTKDRFVSLAGVYDRRNANAQDAKNENVNEGVEDAATAGHTKQSDHVFEVEGINIVVDDEIQAIVDEQPKKIRKRRRAVHGAGGSGLLDSSILAMEVRVTAAATVPFVTSSVTPTPEREGSGARDYATRPILWTQRASERFVVLTNSSYHSGTNAADDEVTSIVRSSMPSPPVLTMAITTTTVVTGTTSTMVYDLGTGQVKTSIFRDSTSPSMAEADVVGFSQLVKLSCDDLSIKASSLEFEKGKLIDQVYALDTTCSGLRDEVMGYKLFNKWVEEMQDEQVKALSDRVAAIDSDLIRIALHMDEQFYSRYLTTIAGWRWILTGIDHEKAGRGLADVAAFNPSVESNFVSAVKALKGSAVEAPEAAQLQPSPEQIMIQIHRSEDQAIIGETSLPFSLELAHNHVQKIRGDATSHRLSLADVIAPLVEPLSVRSFTSRASTSELPEMTTTTALPTTSAQASTVSVTEAPGLVPSMKAPSPSQIVFEKEDIETTPEHASYFSILALLFASWIAACSLFSSKRSKLISKASSFISSQPSQFSRLACKSLLGSQLSFHIGLTHHRHGPTKDLMYKTPFFTAYLPALWRMALAFFFSSGRIYFVRWAKLVDVILLSASAFLFSPLGTPQFGPKRSRMYSDLSSEEKDRYNADIRATNILLQGLPKDIYTLINHYTDAKDIWDNVKMLLEGSELTKEDWESQLFVTAVKLNRGLRDSNYDQLFTYLKQHETHAKENKMMLKRLSQPTVDPLALLSNVSNPQHYSPSSSTSSSTQVPPPLADSSSPAKDLIENLTNTLALLTQSYRTFPPQTNNQLRTSSNAKNQAIVQDGKVVVQNAQENEVALDAEQLLFLADGQDNAFDDEVDEQPIQDLALNVDNVFQAEDCDAFDSDVDEAPTAQTMFMCNLSSADPITDEARPSYDSDILSEVQDHNQYMHDVCAYHGEHVMHGSVQLDHIVDSHADYTSDSIMIQYDQYVKNNEPALYNGHEILKDNHAPAKVHNTEDTLEMAEIAKKKMNDKMNDPELFSVATNSELNVAKFTEMHVANTSIEARCLALEAELAKFHNKSHHDNQKELIHHFSKLELNHLNLQLKYQNLKDSIGNNPPTLDKDTPNFNSVFVIGKMQASLQGKDNIIRQLKKQLSQLQATHSDTDRTLKHYKELYDSIKITRAKHIEQVTKLTTKNVTLKTSVSKDKVKPQVLTRAKHAIDVEPIVPRLRNNRDAHLDYLRNLKESVETIRDIVEEAKVLAHIPLIGKKQVTIATPSDKLERTTHKHVVTVKTQKTNVPVPPSTGVKSCPKASKSQPKRNPKTNRISPAKGANKLLVED
uniref:Integrase, catalytic region, zinc finger, CCHC-type, peptidase aspartic, catalytic n=1 Tax=Tanacetum cinerariifolium TaxID=118510 RepID=A0A6L2J8I3_TANCI|nr:hypothetical protein [Tanacetum cinerariifolium]